MNEGRRNRGLERLNVFVGEWSVEASFPAPEPGRAVFEWILDRQFLVERSEIPEPAAPDGFTIVGLAPDGESYTQHYFDSRGVTRLYKMTFDGRVWTLSREAPDFTPLSFSQRFTGEFADDGDAIRGTWEKTADDGTWERDFDLTYTRVRR